MPHAAAAPVGTRHSGWMIVPLAAAQLIIALDIYIVFVALPQIGRELGFSAQSLQWVISAYVLVFGGFLLLGGRASDLLGRRRVFLGALGIYAVSSLAGGLAGNQDTIIGARAVQGLGGALLFPATLALINTRFAEGPPRNRALAIWGGAGASGLTLGSLLGGLLTGAFGWSAVFFINVPLAAAVALGALAVIPADSKQERARNRNRSFDLPGALTGTAGVTLLVSVLVEGPAVGWDSIGVIASAVVGAALLVLFTVVESRVADPLMPLRLFRNRSLRVAVVITFVFMGTFGALPYFETLLFQDVHGFTAVQTGLAFMVQSVSIFAGTQLGERVTTKITARAGLLIGFLVGAAGTAVLAVPISAGGSYASLVPGLILMGAGQGVAWTAMWVAAAAGVDRDEQGIASGMAATTQQAGYAVGLAILVAIANAGVGGHTGSQLRIALADGIQTTTFVIAGAILLGALIALTLPSTAKPGAPSPAADAEKAERRHPRGGSETRADATAREREHYLS
ncbi:MAG: MFS transporter [Actinobacteria bacterium]|nr:MFS transporter [Actinomycetota bacterium]